MASGTPVSYYQFFTSWEPATTQEKPAFLKLTIGRAYLDEGGSYHIVGEVTNLGDGTANSIKVSGAFFDYNNRVTGDGVAYVTPDNLSPGQTAPFDISVESAPNQQIAFAAYNTQSQEYSMISNALPKTPSTSPASPNG